MESSGKRTFGSRVMLPIIALAAALCFAPQIVRAGEADNTLVVGALTDPQTMDPAVGTLGTDIPFMYTVYDRLIDFEPKTLDMRPGLATSWKWSDDKKTLELKLRQGVKFHDGTDFNAEAVKFYIEYFKDSKRNLDLNSVIGVETPDASTVVLRLDKPNSALLGLLAERAGMVMSPTAIKALGKDIGQKPVGTGPFMLKEWAPGKSLTVVKFPGYWKQGEPKLDAIEFRIIRNATSIVSALQSGQLDYVSSIDPVNLPVLQRNKNVRIAVEPTIAFGIVNLNSGMEPLNDVRVRKAIALSIDRQQLANAAFGGGVSGIPAVLPVPPSYWPSSPQFANAFTYQPDEAKKLLAEAGHPNGITLKMCAPANSGTPLPHAKLVDIMREQMKAAGITVESTSVASNAACNDLYTKKTVPTFMANWTGRPDPAITYAQVLGTTTAFNLGRTVYGNAEEVIAKLLATSDRDEQKKLFEQLNQLWVDNVPMLPLYYYVNVVAYNAKVTGEEPNLLGRPYVRTMSFKK